MKKNLLSFIALTMLATACQKGDIANNISGEDPGAAPTERKCASYEVLQEQLQADPSMRQRMNQIENFTQRFINDPDLQRLSGDSMIIPVVVNVVYKTATENISLSQIQAQIAVLNEDFKGSNTDAVNIPGTFSTVKAGDTKIRFVLDTVIRKLTTVTSWTTNNLVKQNTKGGITATLPTKKLNIWVCTLGSSLLGYAQFPGGPASSDGVVILNKAFGSRAKFSGGYYMNTYDLGRTATHEVGHWLNLRHIWGDATCGDDLVGDTPQHTGANYGCPVSGIKSTCTSTPVMMTMNYMDYTNDACMYMFSSGQKSRMQATYAIGGPRASFR